MKKLFLLAAVCSFAFALTACGGGGGSGEVLQATSDTTIPIDANSGNNVASAVRGTSFNFPSGVPDFGTSGSTTVTFTAAPSSSQLATSEGAQGFAVTSGGQTATGTLQFGSCIFSVSNSTFPTGSPLATGNQFTINPCSLFVQSNGLPADSQARPRIIRLILRLLSSGNVLANVSVNPQGTLFINNIPVFTIIVRELTGLTGG